jgi:hypothetical protein
MMYASDTPGVTLVANGLEGGAALDTLSGNADPSVVRALTMGYLIGKRSNRFPISAMGREAACGWKAGS